MLKLARLHGFASFSIVLFASSIAAAQDDGRVVMEGLEGPANPVGLSVEDVDRIALGAEFPQAGLDWRFMRGRFVIVEPKGIVPIHSHAGRPAITYVVNGTIIEHRSDAVEPITHEAGAVTIDDEGIAQWWENPSEETIRLWVVDFLNEAEAGSHN